MRCVHCGREMRRPRGRGLCILCHRTPSILVAHPITSKYAATRGPEDTDRRPRPLADTPTAAPPGSPEKLAVMESRAAAGRAVFHPDDAKYHGDTRHLAGASPPAPPVGQWRGADEHREGQEQLCNQPQLEYEK